jgi:hypothetical protein
MKMKYLRHMAMLEAALVILTPWTAAPVAGKCAGDQNRMTANDPAPTVGEIRSMVARIVENQHHNDRALEEFERVEHVVSRKSGDNSPVPLDHTDRVIPAGTGNMKLRTVQNGSPVTQDLYRRELQSVVDALELAIHPSDSFKQDLAKFDKRRRQRVELVDAAGKAFRITWAGRETRGSRTLAKLLLDPDPGYKPTSRLTGVFEHVHAVMWVDESQAQIARLEAEIASDITFGGGIIGKVYRGGHFVMEQSEVAPGAWLPTLYTYDVDGRKFLFGFGLHERTEVTRYRHLGPPEQSIKIIRNELTHLSAEAPTR